MSKRICLILLMVQAGFSQNLDYENNGQSIAICTALLNGNVNSFTNQRQANAALDKILSSIGASKRFVLQECSNMNNAVAVSYQGVRYILYDPDFMNEITYSDTYQNMFILAHEVGHHINGHTLDLNLESDEIAVNMSLSSSRVQELEADEFAGFVMGRLGAPLSSLINVLKNISTENDDSYSTHPNLSKRIAAVKKGFDSSGGAVDLKNNRVVESKYSNTSYANVEYLTLTDYYSDAIYTGYVSINTNEPFGFGILNIDDGSKYEGEMAGGLRNGFGKYSWPDGDIYEGEWVNGNYVGEGKYTSKNFTEIGTFKLNSSDESVLAKGKKVYYDEFTGEETLSSEGIFDEDSGLLIQGKFIDEDGISEGLWYKNGGLIRAKITDSNGNITNIGFLDGSEGYGNATYTDYQGTEIEANFEQGQIVTTYYLKKEKDRYSDSNTIHFEDWYSDRVLIELNICKNTDACKKFGYGIPLGSVKHYNDDGYRLKGFANSEKELFGFGEVIYSNDSELQSYSGMFYNDEYNGYGKLTYKNGNIQQGIFLNGRLVESKKFNIKKMKSELVLF